MRRGPAGLWLGATLAALLASEAALAAPLRLLATREAQRLSAPASQPLVQPTDVACDGQGRRYVLDGVNGRIVVFDPAGNYLKAFGQPGQGPGQLRRPVGIGLDPKDGTVFVADTGNARIAVFGAEGNALPAYALPPAEGGRAAEPTDVLPTADGRRLVVVDNDNHLVRLLDRASRRQLQVIGGFGESMGKLRYPATVAEGPDGALYVVDVLGARVVRYKADGTQPRQISGWGSEPGTLFRPKGVAVDGQGRVYVSDSLFGIVQLFGPTGDALGVLGSGGRPLRLDTPTSLALDARGRLHVVETRGGRVRVLEVNGP